MFAHYAPRLYNYYSKTFASLKKSQPELELPVFGSIFSTISINLAPQVVAEKHKDFKNLAYGFCNICAQGSFNPKQGGHLVLWELKLLIEFPPGSHMNILSAIFSHSNTSLQAGETRFSIIQYSAGGLFRWVQYGFRTWHAFEEQEPKEASMEWDGRPTKWQEVLGLFSNISEF